MAGKRQADRDVNLFCFGFILVFGFLGGKGDEVILRYLRNAPGRTTQDFASMSILAQYIEDCLIRYN